MKKRFFSISLLLLSFHTVAEVKFEELAKKDVENVAKEFASNFTHTTSTAPHTSGFWGVEFGLLASQQSSPKLKNTINKSGGDGKDFDSLYSGGGFLRVHIPFEFFFESSILPSLKISDAEVNNFTFGLGWNAGSFFSLPFDLAIGYDVSSGKTSFKQKVSDKDHPALIGSSKVKLESHTQKAWLGITKKVFFLRPFAKFGFINMNSNISSSANVNYDFLDFTDSKKHTVKKSSNYWSAGIQADISIFSLGIETMSVFGNQRTSIKLGFSF